MKGRHLNDPILSTSGEMFIFGYEVLHAPYATYRVISKDGVMGDPVPITISGPAMMHDWAITENFAIFIDCSVHFSTKAMVDNQFAFTFDRTKPIRFGVLPRYAKDDSQMCWFECSNGLLLHTVQQMHGRKEMNWF
jgi:carotenoid cleavage dioxygenase-like enzyme